MVKGEEGMVTDVFTLQPQSTTSRERETVAAEYRFYTSALLKLI